MRWRGKVPSVGCACRWDPSSCKLKSDASALAALFQDEAGRRYLHHVDAVTGEVAEFAEDGKTITGGQVWQICDVVERLNLPRVTVETNGIGQRSEEHTSELQSLMRISYAVFCLKKKNTT